MNTSDNEELEQEVEALLDVTSDEVESKLSYSEIYRFGQAMRGLIRTAIDQLPIFTYTDDPGENSDKVPKQVQKAYAEAALLIETASVLLYDAGLKMGFCNTMDEYNLFISMQNLLARDSAEGVDSPEHEKRALHTLQMLYFKMMDRNIRNVISFLHTRFCPCPKCQKTRDDRFDVRTGSPTVKADSVIHMYGVSLKPGSIKAIIDDFKRMAQEKEA